MERALPTLHPSTDRRPERSRLGDLCRPGDATRLRIQGLDPACVGALELAAVIGREFDLAVLALASGARLDQLEANLRPALNAGVLQALSATRLRFAHATMRESLYRTLGVGRAVRLHQRVGDALESLHGGDARRASEIAHHFRQVALAGGDATNALRYSEIAADSACAVLAYEEAALQLERALEILDSTASDRAGGQDERRLRLLEALHRIRRAGKQEDGARGAS